MGSAGEKGVVGGYSKKDVTRTDLAPATVGE